MKRNPAVGARDVERQITTPKRSCAEIKKTVWKLLPRAVDCQRRAHDERFGAIWARKPPMMLPKASMATIHARIGRDAARYQSRTASINLSTPRMLSARRKL